MNKVGFELINDSWLSSVTRKQCFSLSSEKFTKEHMKTIIEELNNNTFCTVKIEAGREDEVAILIELGFRLIETSLNFNKNLGVKSKGKEDRAKESSIEYIRKQERKRAVEIIKISGNSFNHSRFFRDKHIKRKVQTIIKEEWVASYFKGERGTNLIVINENERIVGFVLLCEKFNGSNTTTGIIDLIAVKSNSRGKGYGRSLIESAEFLGHKSGWTEIEIGTQTTNLPAMRLYNRCGYILDGSAYTLHYGTL